LLAGRPAKVNLIPFNPFPGTQYRRSGDAADLGRFRDELLRSNVHGDPCDAHAGEDIDAGLADSLSAAVQDRTVAAAGASGTAAAAAGP